MAQREQKLSAKQEAFIREYLLDLNATQAAIRAGYSAHTAASVGAENLRKPQIVRRVNEAKGLRSEKTNINAEWLLKRLTSEAEADITDIYNEDGSIKPMKEWPLIWRQGLVAGITTQVVLDVEGMPKIVVGKVKISDRGQRLAMIGKHVSVNAFQDIVKHDVTDGLADRLARARAKLREEK